MDIVTPLDLIIPTCSMVFAWLIVYSLICLVNQQRSYEWNCRLVSIFHACLVTLLSYWCGFQTGPWPFDALGYTSTPFQTLILLISFGYFIFDFIWCVYMETEGPVMLIHHVTSVLTLGYALSIGLSGSEIIAAIFGMEMTNPFLQLRWFLRETGNYQTRLAYGNDFIFMALFLYLRLGPGSILTYHTTLAEKPTILIKAGGLILYLVSIIWSILILRFARYRFFGKKKN
ncbi:TLC domain-containing protein 5-like [Actinia tenebrosa]|uniref:TLC domain-containing protein 5-like n=1 Tax=Actinia tenebrosa TaxID=6105 RepID=A0A6P8I8T3_ACTTE|nr:TLC domain-containing protein 5-like [Actinia tenebrosa]